MDLLGRQFIGYGDSAQGTKTFRAGNPLEGGELAPVFHESTEGEVDRALELANAASEEYRVTKPEERSLFLRRIADGIEGLGEELLKRADAETALGITRLTGERGRTASQLRMFADLIEEGSWVDARIDTAQPEREPMPRPALRRMLVPLGPVVVFGASNFPLAFSVAGGDTASALAAGCPVVVKGHPAHPGTSELVARVIVDSAQELGLPEGTFSMVQGSGHEVGLALVRHPLVKAVAFTGSFRGGKALYDAAAARPEPIPVFAEMGSSNPVFVLPGALEQRGESIAQGLINSVTLGAGQFCTNPGFVAGIEGEGLERFQREASARIAERAPASMLYPGICKSYTESVERATRIHGVEEVAGSSVAADSAKNEAAATLLSTDSETLRSNPSLSEEIFGPVTLVVRAKSKEDLLSLAEELEGHLTATIHATEEELGEYGALTSVLSTKAGRLLFNGFPTGVEVVPSMQHGGPFPATTEPRSTSVGTAAIYRFVRPVCYQGFPSSALPEELRDDNPRGIWRLVDNDWTKSGVAG